MRLPHWRQDRDSFAIVVFLLEAEPSQRGQRSSGRQQRAHPRSPLESVDAEMLSTRILLSGSIRIRLPVADRAWDL